MATMRDVAQTAGVSHITVSRAFNHADLVSAETRARVLAAARDLGYRPNCIARSMVTGKTMSIEVIASHYFGSPMIAEIERAAAERDYSVIYTLADGTSSEKQRIERLLQQRVDGLISVCSSAVADHSPLQTLCDEGVPVVTINRYAGDLPCSKVFFANARGQRDAVQHLIDAGHERIAFVGGCPDHPQQCVRDQIQSYHQTLEANGLDADGLQWFGGTDVEDGEQLGLECLQAPAPPTAVVAVNDQIAAGILRAAYALRLRVPDDLSLIGFGDSLIAGCTAPALTSVGFPYAEASREAVRLLLDRIARDSEVTSRVVLRRILIERESCCGPTQGSRVRA